MVIPKGYSSINWCRRLKQDEYEALWKWMNTWTIVTDAGKELILAINDNAPEYMQGIHQVFVTDKYKSYSKTLNDLKTQMSVFLEGYQAKS